MISNYSEKSSYKKVSSFIAVASALFIQALVTPANADEVVASFERMLNPVETVVQQPVFSQSEHDPLYTMVNASLWSAPTSNENIVAASFDRMFRLVEATQQPTVAYRTERDPLYKLVNAKLWNAPSGDDVLWATLVVYAQPK